ncbi:hypothetical protein M8994_17235 [Brucella sp. 21LCYQ03]|nr:hypothetical protein [Brucella sp. 21LCYQ03]
MRDFGFFTFENSVAEDSSGQSVPILILRDANGADWFDLVKEHPHAFYIAINSHGEVYSMEIDYEASQIPGHLIGIDEDFGFTRGIGGTVYGKVWNGIAIVEPEPEPAVVVVPSVTLWERMTNNEAEQVEAAMSTQPFRTRQIFMTAKTFRSDHELWPLLVQMATELFGEMRASELLAPPI